MTELEIQESDSSESEVWEFFDLTLGKILFNPNTLANFPESIKEDPFFWERAWQMVQHETFFLWETEFKYLMLLSKLGSYVPCFPQKLENNLAFFSLAADLNGCAIQYASKVLRQNKALALKAVSQNGMALRYLKHFQEDEEIVRRAILTSPRAIMYASFRLRNLLGMEVVARCGMALEHVDCKNRALVLTAVEADGMALQFAGEYSDEEAVVERAIRRNPHAIRYANLNFEEAKNSEVTEARLKINTYEKARRLQELAVSLDPMTLQNIADADKSLILMAMAKNGLALKVAFFKWKNDEEVVETAIRENPHAIEFASSHLKVKFASLAKELSSTTAKHLNGVEPGKRPEIQEDLFREDKTASIEVSSFNSVSTFWIGSRPTASKDSLPDVSIRAGI